MAKFASANPSSSTPPPSPHPIFSSSSVLHSLLAQNYDHHSFFMPLLQSFLLHLIAISLRSSISRYLFLETWTCLSRTRGLTVDLGGSMKKEFHSKQNQIKKKLHKRQLLVQRVERKLVSLCRFYIDFDNKLTMFFSLVQYFELLFKQTIDPLIVVFRPSFCADSSERNGFSTCFVV